MTKEDRDKNEELLNKQLELLAEKSPNADLDTLVSLTDAMCKVYETLKTAPCKASEVNDSLAKMVIRKNHHPERARQSE